MSIDYVDVLKRLREERYRLGLSQKEMSHYVRMSQSNYSKVELGLRRMDFYDLKHLCESEADVYYIYTNQRSKGIYKDFLCLCEYSELICVLNILYSVLACSYKKIPTEQVSNIIEKLKYITWIEGNHSTDNIFIIARRSMNYQQQKMAGILGIDIKKLRDLENGRCLPDSELLCRLYKLFYISPSVILKDRKGMINEISFLLETLDIEISKKLFEIIQTVHSIR